MIWFAALDPSNLALYFDTSLIANGSSGEQITRAIHNCVFGNVKGIFENLNQIETHEDAVRCMYLVSTIWHEQRHFLDLILTSYGGYIFRQFATCYMNSPSILQEVTASDKKIIFPLSVYADPVRLTFLGQENHQHTSKRKEVARDLLAREFTLSLDRRKIDNTLEMGGYAFLEEIASIFQISAVENFFGTQYTQEINEHISRLDPTRNKYLWSSKFRNLLRFPELNTERGIIQRVGLVPIKLYAALSYRGWNQDSTDDPNKAKRLFPIERLHLITNYISERPSEFSSHDFEEIWENVNKGTKFLFGRTIVEEIEADIYFHEQMLNRVSEIGIHSTIHSILHQHLDLRKHLFSVLKTHPQLILHPDEYCRQTLPKIMPIPIYVTPLGANTNLLSGSIWEALHQGAILKQSGESDYFFWTATPKVNLWEGSQPGTFGFVDIKPWNELARFWSPLAKLMLKGRNHRTSIGPELLTVERELESAGIEVVYEEEFKYPRMLTSSARHIYEVRGIDEGVCDICGQMATSPSGQLLSPWIFFKNANARDLVIHLYGGGEDAYIKYDKDWSAWFLCDSCYEQFTSNALI